MFTLARPAPSPPLTTLASVSSAAATPRTVITLVTVSTAIPVGASIRPMPIVAISIAAPIPSMAMVIPVSVPVGIAVPTSTTFSHFKFGTQHVVVVVQHGAVVGGWAEINTNTTHKHGVGLETFHAGSVVFTI